MTNGHKLFQISIIMRGVSLITQGKILNNKKLKEKDLFEAAYELFINKGFQNTAIDDIVKKAGVAKGTFYLYFKDKYDIIDKIILRKSSIILKEALENTMMHEHENMIEAFLDLIDYIINYFKNNKTLLKLIYKNLSWGIYRKAQANYEEYKELSDIFNKFLKDMTVLNHDMVDIDKTIFMIIELTGSVCYSSIILEEPNSMDEMKPFLFKMIRKMLLN